MNPDQTVLAPEKFIGWARKSMEKNRPVVIKLPHAQLLSMKVILLINVKMPKIVGILTFSSMINTTSERLKANTSSFVGILVFMSS